MNKQPNPKLIDDDNPEWTPDMFAQAVTIDKLPPVLQHTLRNIRHATIEPDPMIAVEAPILRAFLKGGI